MSDPLKALAATCLLAGVVHAGVARAAGNEPDPPSADASRTTPIAQDARRDETLAPPRFVVTGTNRSQDPLDTSEAAPDAPTGPQYTISRHVTLGSALERLDGSDSAANPEPARH